VLRKESNPQVSRFLQKLPRVSSRVLFKRFNETLEETRGSF
jgi:hypothetical protein